MPARCLSAAVACVVLLPASLFAQGLKFSSEFEPGVDKAKKESKLVIVHFTQKNSPGCAMLIKNVFNNVDGTALSKKYYALRVAAEDEKGNQTFQKYGVNTTPTVMILDPSGEELVYATVPNLNEFNAMLNNATELHAGLEALAKAKNSPTATAAALKKIGGVASKRSQKILREHAENDSYSEAVRRVALEGMGKQKDVASDLVDFLDNKSLPMRTMAFNQLKAMGPTAMPALLDGLNGTNADQRSNCFALAYPHTKNAKIARDANFWKTAKSEQRVEARKAWQDWWEKNKPADGN